MKKILALTSVFLSFFLFFGCNGNTTTLPTTASPTTELETTLAPTTLPQTTNPTTTETPATTTLPTTIPDVTITFETSGGIDVSPIVAESGEGVYLPVTTRIGYTFLGWSLSDDSGAPLVTEPFVTTSDVTLYAKWSVNVYELTYLDYDGSIIYQSEFDYQADLSELSFTLPTRVGYSFNGWDIETPTTMPANDVTINALYEINQYTISFETYEGSSVDSITQDYNTVILAPTEPTKEGYAFNGWFSDAELTQAFVFSTMPADDITLYAKWDILAFRLTYLDYDGYTMHSEYYDFQEDLSSIEVYLSERTGYTFIGWDIETPATMPAYDLTITALYEINQYTISFVSNGGSPVLDIIQDYDTVVLAPEEPIKDHYLFIGWFIDEELEVTYTFTNMPAEHITLYAKWQILQYDINYRLYEDFDVTGMINLYPGETFTTIASAYSFVAVLTSEGRLFTVGNNDNGQLGNGTSFTSYWPVEITDNFNLDSGETIVKIYLGDFHALAMTSSGRVFSWGGNWDGQLGDGTPFSSSLPIDITSQFSLELGETILDIRAGGYHNAMLTSTGRLFTWGANSHGQLGDGTNDVKISPVDITANFPLIFGETIVSFALGDNFSSAISSNNRVFTWGLNIEGYLGDGTTNDKNMPTEITSQFSLAVGETINFIAMGNMHSVALSSLGRVFSWGGNWEGQLGDGTNTNSLVPIDITSQFILNPGENIISFSLGVFHSSALTSSGRIFTWGGNGSGQLGDGTTVGYYNPADVTSNFSLEAGELLINLAFGDYQSVGLTSLGNVFVWGANDYGQLGDGTNISILTPTKLLANLLEYPALVLTDAFDYDSLITEYIPASRLGYDFSGWYLDYLFTEPYTFSTMPGENITLYGRWVPWSEDNPSDYIFTLLVDDTYEVTEYTGSGGIVVIPSSYLGKPVTSIGANAFYNKPDINIIIIPYSVTNIGAWAFAYCSYVTDFLIGANVTTIGDYAFRYCSSLESIIIPNSVTSLGSGAFSECSLLSSVIFESGSQLTVFKDSLFASCTSLTTIEIPASLMTIESFVFQGCLNLISITVEETNAYFSADDGVLFDKLKTKIVKYPMAKLETSYIIPETVTTIGDRAFLEAYNLTEIIFPSSLTVIEAWAFSYCSGLTTVFLPSTVTTLGDGAFADCTSLTVIIIPLNVTVIGNYAFSNCNNLTIFVEAASLPSGWSVEWNITSCPVAWGYVPE